MRFFENVGACFGLGTLTTPPVAVEGGLSNALHRIETEQGAYAVKRMVANADSPAFKANVEASFAVERLAHAAGIAMPKPVPVPGTAEALGRVDANGTPCWVRVHEWVTARRVTAHAVRPADIDQLGTILASLHRLPCPHPGHPAALAQPAIERDWPSALLPHATRPALTDAIRALEDIVRRGYEASRPRQVLSHRDLDAKNLLRKTDGTLVVIDWDAAGPVDRRWDVVGVAMDWSGIWDGAVSPEAFAAVLDAYEKAGGSLGAVTPASFAGWAEGVLDWLWFNLERAGVPDPGERRRGRAEVAATARSLPTAASWIATRSSRG